MANRWLSALLGISAYQRPPSGSLPSLDSSPVETIREALGGQLAPPLLSQTRVYLADVESAEYAADNGDMAPAARLMRAARKDGTLAGVLSTRFGGLVRLPKRFRGLPEAVADLEAGHELEGDEVSVRSVFEDMCPPAELALLAADGDTLGVGVAELVPVEGRDYPVLVRMDPEFLFYRWNENRWYFRAVAGLIPITPGDGRWVLHTPCGRIAPWQQGLWRAIVRAFVRKEHAALHKDNWEAKLANPARVAVAPQGASEGQQQSWFQAVMAWGVNTVFGMTPGYDVKLLESNGRGWESFVQTIEAQDREMIIAVAGQTVTTDGGAGFQNSDIHKAIRADLIQASAESLAYTINTQVLPSFVVQRWGEEGLRRGAIVEYDAAPARDKMAVATSLTTTAQAITQLTEALRPYGRTLDVGALCAEFGVPIMGDVNGDGQPEQAAKPALRLVETT